MQWLSVWMCALDQATSRSVPGVHGHGVLPRIKLCDLVKYQRKNCICPPRRPCGVSRFVISTNVVFLRNDSAYETKRARVSAKLAQCVLTHRSRMPAFRNFRNLPNNRKTLRRRADAFSGRDASKVSLQHEFVMINVVLVYFVIRVQLSNKCSRGTCKTVPKGANMSEVLAAEHQMSILNIMNRPEPTRAQGPNMTLI